MRVERFVPPGGGRGYYRTPSLVSMWATAPYLHNNALGDYAVARDGGRKMVANDGSQIVGAIDVSVDGRMAMFQDAVEKLLWPERRRLYVKRTLADCRLADLRPLVRDVLTGVVLDRGLELAEEKVGQVVRKFVADKNLPEPVAGVLVRTLTEQAKAKLADLRRRLQAEGPAAVRDELNALYRDLGGLIPPAVGERAAELKEKLEGLAGGVAAEIERLSDLDALTVPKGTPINLYFNLQSAALPYAVKVHLKHRGDPRALAEALLKLSTCPDLVEDRGHEYGKDLSDGDKKDLIEFLKTL